MQQTKFGPIAVEVCLLSGNRIAEETVCWEGRWCIERFLTWSIGRGMSLVSGYLGILGLWQLPLFLSDPIFYAHGLIPFILHAGKIRSNIIETCMFVLFWFYNYILI